MQRAKRQYIKYTCRGIPPRTEAEPGYPFQVLGGVVSSQLRNAYFHPPPVGFPLLSLALPSSIIQSIFQLLNLPSLRDWVSRLGFGMGNAQRSNLPGVDLELQIDFQTPKYAWGLLRARTLAMTGVKTLATT